MPGSVMSTSMSSDDSFNHSGMSDDYTPQLTTLIKSENDACCGCGGHITDRYLLMVNDRAWHGECLRCCVCRVNLDRSTSCFTKGNNIYCKVDYNREFGTKCAKCLRHINATDWVRRAKDNVYHLACFACDSCKRQLSTGEEFALQDNRVLCKAHYIEVIEGGPHEDGGCQKQKTKRVRTTFGEEQVQVLQANFQLDSNPDGQDLERIAQITGLSKRVTQVWFQNSRARQKKHQQNKMNNVSTSPGGSAALTSVTYSMSPSPGARTTGTLSPNTMMANEVTLNNNHLNDMLNDGMNGMSTPLSLSLPCSTALHMSSPDNIHESWHNSCSDTSLSFVS